MNKTLRITLIVVSVLVGAAALVWTGFAFGRSVAWGADGFYPGGMMGSYNQGDRDAPYGYGAMMGSSNFGPGEMMGSYNQGERGTPYGYGTMMGGSSGMMGSYNSQANVEPLSVDAARTAVESYLISFGNEDLALKEIMVFDNNAYAIIVEKSTGIGAFELLVDPVTKAVYPEYGPNMMWNLKYGMMSSFGGYGMMGPGMMMGGSGYGPGSMMNSFGNSDTTSVPELSAELSVTPEKASEMAQSYLDQYYPGVEVLDEVTAFYGYYTIDTQKNGAIVGMLSVNGFTGQVFPHTWHGDFIEMSEE